MDELIERAAGDRAVLKKIIAIPADQWNEPLRRIDIANPLLHNARLPGGLEAGANMYFRWGGYTAGGAAEIVIDPAGAAAVRVSGKLFRH
jgi:hypothetical protein